MTSWLGMGMSASSPPSSGASALPRKRSVSAACTVAPVGFFGAAGGGGVRILEPERTVLRANVTVLPDDPQDLGGQTRRILAQLTVTVTPQGTECRR
jgi:hypothetical protein